MPVIIEEVGWPTDGDPNANVEYARRFNQGLINRIISGKGDPKRPSPPDIYLCALLDVDTKSIDPGSFERHHGIYYYDGTIKYTLNMTKRRIIAPAKVVKYLLRRWCVMSPQASLSDPTLLGSIGYACSYTDCMIIKYGSSSSNHDARYNASYAFIMYYQRVDQRQGACSFNNLSALTTIDPSMGSCRFEIMIDMGTHDTTSSSGFSRRWRSELGIAFWFVLGYVWMEVFFVQ